MFVLHTIHTCIHVYICMYVAFICINATYIQIYYKQTMYVARKKNINIISTNNKVKKTIADMLFINIVIKIMQRYDKSSIYRQRNHLRQTRHVYGCRQHMRKIAFSIDLWIHIFLQDIKLR